MGANPASAAQRLSICRIWGGKLKSGSIFGKDIRRRLGDVQIGSIRLGVSEYRRSHKGRREKGRRPRRNNHPGGRLAARSWQRRVGDISTCQTEGDARFAPGGVGLIRRTTWGRLWARARTRLPRKIQRTAGLLVSTGRRTPPMRLARSGSISGAPPNSSGDNSRPACSPDSGAVGYFYCGYV